MAFTLSTTAGAVTLYEQWDAFEKGIDIQRGPFVKAVYLVKDWSVTDQVCNALMGPPHTCPTSPNLVCLAATCKGLGELDPRTGGRPTFRGGLVEATYGLRTWEEQASEDPAGSQSFPNEASPGQPYLYMEQSIDFDTEVVKLPNTSYKFLATPQLPLHVPVARTIAVAQFVLVRRWQSALPYANVTAYLNKLNSAVFLGQPIGQIKFRKARTRRQFKVDGTRTQEVEYVFQWREFDHNKVHRPDDTSWDFIVDDAGNKPYAYANLATLLA